MFFGMGGHGGGIPGGKGCGICDNNSLWLLFLLNSCGGGINKDDILELLFLVMLLECFGCGFDKKY